MKLTSDTQANNLYYESLFRLDGKVAVVTGGAGILGRHVCEGLAACGAQVAIVDIQEHEARQLAKSLVDRYNVRCIGCLCDVSNKKSVQQMVRTVVKMFGRIDILLNNAATKTAQWDRFFTAYEHFSLNTWKDVMAVNIDGMFLVSQAIGTEMIKQQSGGSIIQTSSIYGMLGPDSRIYEGSFHQGKSFNTPAVYAASKAAVYGLTRYLATYWAKHRIRVNMITPGGIDSGQNDRFRQAYCARTPLGRMADPREIVGAFIYLASDASSYVTGQNIIVDGGYSAW